MKKSSKNKPRGAVTLDDVAKIAGVSASTVSRALNYPERVIPKTREKINAAIARTGYVPNLIAGGLASQRTKLIAAIVYSMENSVHAETITHFTHYLRSHGYQVILGETAYQEDLEEVMVATVLSRRPEGIFLTGSKHTPACLRMLLAADIPVVEAWNLTSNPLDVVVGISYEKIGRAIADLVLKKGYRKIAMVSAENDYRSDLRCFSCQEHLREKGGINPLWIRTPSPTNFGIGRDSLKTLLESGFDEGAIICSADNLAHGVLTEAIALGIPIPDQLGVIGFGDLPFAQYTHPALTTVRFDRKVIGYTAAEVLLKRINNKDVTNRSIDVGFEFIERDTL